MWELSPLSSRVGWGVKIQEKIFMTLSSMTEKQDILKKIQRFF